VVEPHTLAALDDIDVDARRLVPLEGGHNFRDIGGYQTADGAWLRWGLVFRSGSMAELTPEDQERIGQLGIKVICDFRANRERETRPTRWPKTVAVDLWTRDHESSVGEFIAALRHPGVTAEAVRERMIAAYRTLPYEQGDSYRELFLRLATGQLPLVFHCSAGKDRTGIAAALLLSLLGVPRDAVIKDYLLTERFFERGCRLLLTDPSSSWFTHVDPRIWEPMMRADRAYIEAAIETLEQLHGSIEGFLHDVLGIDANMKSELRRRLIA
jgi:protein-tyrosine phosphatase